MKAKYNVTEIANWFINELHPEPLKLQKLLYFAQGYSYAFNDKPLFDEDIEAWVHGPVVPSVYYKYKNFVFNPITIEHENVNLDNETLEILNYVKNNFSKYDSKYLEEMTHNQEPWILSREGLDPDERSDKTISKESISAFFLSNIFEPDVDEWGEI